MPSETAPDPDENDFVHWPSAPGTSLTGLDKSMILASVEELAPSLAPGGPLPASTSFSDQEEADAAASGKFYPASRAWFRTTEPLAADGEKKERWWQDEAPAAAPTGEKAPAPAPAAEAASADNEPLPSPEEIWELAAKELSRAAALPESGAPEPPPPPEEKKPKVVLPERKRPASLPPARPTPPASPAAASPFSTVNPAADNFILAENDQPATPEPASGNAAESAPASQAPQPEVASPFFFVPEPSEPEPEPAKAPSPSEPPSPVADIKESEGSADREAEEGALVILPPEAIPAVGLAQPREESPTPFLATSPFSLDPPPAESSRRPLLPAQRMFQQIKEVEPGAPATPPLEEVHGDDIVFPSSEWQQSPSPHARKRLRAAEPEIQEATPEPEPRRSKAGLMLWLLLLLLAAAVAVVIWRERLPEPWRGRANQIWESVFFSFEQVPTRPVPSQTPAATAPSAATPPVSSTTPPEAVSPIPADPLGTEPTNSPPPDAAPTENDAAISPPPAETPAAPPQPAVNETLTPAPAESPTTPETNPAVPEEEPTLDTEAPSFPGIIVPQSGTPGNANAAPKEAAFSGEVPLAEAAELAQAKDAVAALITASTVEEMLPCVFDAATLEPKMREYHAAHPLKPLHDAVIEMEYSGVIPSNGLRAYIFNVLHPSRPKGFPVAAEFSDGRYLVDWESHIQWRDEWLRSFLSSKKNTPQSLMLVLHRTHYFNDDVPLLDEKLAFKATSAIPGDEGTVVFVDKQSALGRSLASEYEWRVSYFPLAELQWVTEDGKQYVRLNRILRPNWRRGAR